MPKNKSKGKNKNKNKTFKTGMNSSKEFSKVNKNKPTATVVAPKRFRSSFDEELNNLKERNGQISNKKSSKNTQPITLAPASFRPVLQTQGPTDTLAPLNTLALAHSSSPEHTSALSSEIQSSITSQSDHKSIGRGSNTYDALSEPEAANFKFALKPSLLTSLAKQS